MSLDLFRRARESAAASAAHPGPDMFERLEDNISNYPLQHGYERHAGEGEDRRLTTDEQDKRFGVASNPRHPQRDRIYDKIAEAGGWHAPNSPQAAGNRDWLNTVGSVIGTNDLIDGSEAVRNAKSWTDTALGAGQTALGALGLGAARGVGGALTGAAGEAAPAAQEAGHNFLEAVRRQMRARQKPSEPAAPQGPSRPITPEIEAEIAAHRAEQARLAQKEALIDARNQRRMMEDLEFEKGLAERVRQIKLLAEAERAKKAELDTTLGRMRGNIPMDNRGYPWGQPVPPDQSRSIVEALFSNANAGYTMKPHMRATAKMAPFTALQAEEELARRRQATNLAPSVEPEQIPLGMMGWAPLP